MKWLEIIKVSSPEKRRESVEKAIDELVAKSKIEGLRNIRVFHEAGSNTIKIQMYWDSEPMEPNGSVFGLFLVHILREFGMASHSVWIEKDEVEKRSAKNE